MATDESMQGWEKSANNQIHQNAVGSCLGEEMDADQPPWLHHVQAETIRSKKHLLCLDGERNRQAEDTFSQAAKAIAVIHCIGCPQ